MDCPTHFAYTRFSAIWLGFIGVPGVFPGALSARGGMVWFHFDDVPLNDWWNNQKPIGRGTVYMVNCDTGEPSESGHCESPNLIWIGNFHIAATCYARVVNDNAKPTIFTLTVQ